MADFDGQTWTRDEFTAHLNSIKLPSWVGAVTIHCVAVPMKLFYDTTKSTDDDVDAAQRMRNMFTDVKQRLKGVAYHAVSFPHGQIGKATDMQKHGNHASTWNDDSLGIEMFFDGDSNDVFTEGGKIVLDTAAWWAAQILKKIGKPATNETVRFHRDEPAAKRKGKTCPGKNVKKDEFIARVQYYMDGMGAGGGGSTPPEEKKETPKSLYPQDKWTNTPGDTLNLRVSPMGAIKGSIPHNTKLSTWPILASGWAEVKTPAGYEGWVAGKYLSEAPNLPVQAQSENVGSTDREQPKAAHELSMSDMGRKMLESFEGLRLTAYDDNGAWAIGYGHSARSGRPPHVAKGLTITKEQADQILAADLEAEYTPKVRKQLKVPLTQSQFDALVSFCYNTSTKTFNGLMEKINAKDFDGAKAYMMAAVLPPSHKAHAGLVRRRKAEVAFFDGKPLAKW